MLVPPVLLLVFNRPDLTREVFASIRKVQPARLFIAADGPREGRPDDAEKCEQARSVLDMVDWDCEVSTLFREKNLGCRMAVSTAIDWFFAHVEEGIVLEDDCLPSQSFFFFCQELLERYRHDNRVMQICGSNLLGGWAPDRYSYLFSYYGPVWGWASWRRAWQSYDVEMKSWPRCKEIGLLQYVWVSQEEVRLREKIYDDIYMGKLDTWDYQWGFAKFINSGLSIIPKYNLISNIGFDEDATHTTTKTDRYYINQQRYDIGFPLAHPEFIIRDYSADREFVERFMLGKQHKTDSFSLFSKIYRAISGE